jgi:hypothetical protein
MHWACGFKEILVIKIYDSGHEIGIRINLFTGMERIFLDNQEMSSGWSFGGRLHKFDCDTDGEITTFEIDTVPKWHLMSRSVTVRQNGKIIFTDR